VPALGGRPTWMALGLVIGVLSTSNAQAQTPPAQAAQAAPAPRVFASDAGLVLNFIRPDKTADFEAVMTKLKEALQKSAKPERKQQLASWKVYKAEPGMGGNALYLLVIDPAVKGAEYDLLMLFSESLGAEAGTPANQEAMKKYVGAFASGVSLLTLTPVAK